MTGIKIEDVAFVRFSTPHLAQMKAYLADFGLQVTQADDSRLFARGAGGAPFIHATEKSEPGFVALGLRARSLADLEALAASEQVPITVLDAPGGGYVLVLTDPDGHRIEVVAGQTLADPLPLPAPTPWNRADAQPRLRQTKRTGNAAAHGLRLGHCVLNVSDFRASERWYKDRSGLSPRRLRGRGYGRPDGGS
jgi:catechol 2,3-dioxygenase-like lactoylglutathione lyase family enzyme